ncbi:MAG: hypothetical protein Q9220_005025 [cf. Caloplaca sp. 1 TL-2023]
MNTQPFDLVVVGAGISGIAAAKFHLDIHPDCNLVLLEKDGSVGGVWNSTRVFDSFFTQSPLGTWEFSDMPMPKPIDEDIYNQTFRAKNTFQYLEKYIDHYKYAGLSIRDRVRFSFDVLKITKNGSTWNIAGQDKSGHDTSLQSHKIIVASGLTSVASMPTLPGQEHFQKPVLHQKDFGQSTLLSNPDVQHITILGGAKSAADMVYDCAIAGKTVTWIIRGTGTGPGFFVSTETGPSPRTIYSLSTMRIMSVFSPSVFNADSWLNRFLQRTHFGRKQLRKFWDGVNKSVIESPKFDDRGEDAEKRGFHNLKPVTPVFWQNQGAGLINRPDFWETIAGKVKVYRQDIDMLDEGIIRLQNGEDVRSDAILCGTGWVPSLRFFDTDLAAELGIPQPVNTYPREEAEKWSDLEKAADHEVIERFPLLADPPEHYRTPITHTPYRLYSGIAPLEDSSIAFVGHVLIANYFRVSECQAMWATAYIDGKIKLPSLEARRKDVALFVAWCRRRYLSNGDRGHWMSAEQTGYTDRLFHQMGLSSHRRFWLWDSFSPSSKKDLHRVRAEYIKKHGGNMNGLGRSNSAKGMHEGNPIQNKYTVSESSRSSHLSPSQPQPEPTSSKRYSGAVSWLYRILTRFTR